MVYEDLFKCFLESVPEAADYCKERLKAMDIDENDGMHICYGFVVRPYVKQIMHDGKVSTLEKIALFFEKMETCGNSLVAEVLEQSIMEHLLAEDRDLIAQYDNVWGQETKEAFKAVGRFVA